MLSFESHDLTDAVAVTLIGEYLDERESTFPPAQGEYQRIAADPVHFSPGRGAFLVVSDDGELLGCGGVRLIDDGPRGARAEVKHVFTRPAARGRGVARALMVELEERARGLGAAEIVLDTNDSLTAAGQLYRTLGFDRVEPYNDNPNATAWYAKPLDADAAAPAV
ncbi:GNAT family N-acetyltransferase [Mycetocola reblochoni]|uniref:Acetyltransferase n=2 Tax=Mycetocola reblochoni TaxID=331618 RepID=A0A1R4K7U5_9MICO|nr:GNAT family N-acetyltransferase [Mycetocola reblochoni]RLP67833.1 GNAT family N-acetyltransferase [Mycetocola reblochoni]SJN40400.1 acetyltransferase [Mycetocola reblochoni REB411]